MSTEQTQISVSDIAIDVIKKDIKNMHLSVYPPTGRVRISAPLDMSMDSIRLFAISKLSWIKKQVRGFQNQDRQPDREYIQGESHYYKGNRYLLNIIEREAKPEVKVRNKKFIDLYVRPNADREKRQEVMREWYRAELKETAEPLIEEWKEKIGVEVNDWGVRRMKTKWGSCNAEDHRIWFNLELAKKSYSSIEYIVVHELIHLRERLHTDRFKALMDKFMPNWKERREALNELVF
ncbi:MAG: M48 family metallopeptidase [Bacteroidota bacterium]